MRGIIGPMRDLGHRLLIGLAAVAVGVMAIGYAFIFGGIAAPVRGDLAVLDVPPSGTATADVLDDGRPIFVVNDPSAGIVVLDAQVPRRGSGLGIAVAWCAESLRFVDPADGSAFAADGTVRSGPAEQGLVAFSARPSPDDPSRVIVGSDTTARGRIAETDEGPDTTCPEHAWVVHEPQPDETFDPSVAVDQEPPGWIWLEGTARVVEGEVRLCDGRADGCGTSAATIGIDPASLGDGPTSGQFIGRVRDDALEGLILVPDA